MRRCFVISPIGEPNTPVREHADDVFNYIVRPAAEPLGIHVVRGDHFKEPGKITEQTFRAITESDLCIALLTGHNPNVFYELAFAQAASKPVIALIHADESVPFDIHDLRRIEYDFRPRSVVDAIHSKVLHGHLDEFLRTEWRPPPPFGGLLGPSRLAAAPFRYDVFVAHPMFGAGTDAEYQAVRSLAFGVVNFLEGSGHRCHFPARQFESREGLLDPGYSHKNFALAIRESRYFLLLYPARQPSTVLVEAGHALALGKRAIYFVRSRLDLPYGLRQPENLDSVKIYECVEPDGVLNLFKSHGLRAFEPW